jgi:hypothetical protein
MSYLITQSTWPSKLPSREAEEVTKQRKPPKKGARKRTTRSKAKKQSSDESEADSYITDDGEVELLDFIEVECSP